MKISLFIVKKSDANIKIKIGKTELMGLPESIEYDYLNSTMKIKMHTIISNELAEKVFKELEADEIEVTNEPNKT